MAGTLKQERRADLHAFTGEVRLGAGDAEGPGGLQDVARLREDVLDGGADGGVVDQHDAVTVLLAQPERLLHATPPAIIQSAW